ncbi:MAG: mdoB [Ramlibacter sp.]|jgi:phosphoglycerol transferase|nr:mdoB [Ramlibacter sp.]
MTSPRALLRFAAYLAAFFIAALALWIGRAFGDTTLDQALWHLQYAERAALGMSGIFLVEFLVEVVALSILAAAMAALLHTWTASRVTRAQGLALYAIPALACVGAIATLALQFSVVSYAAAYFGPDRFAQAYVPPHRVRMVQEHKRNLVIIYAESLEASYRDSGLFGRNLLASLDRVGGRRYTSYRQVPGATWTIAGMVATQCGVPLKVYSEANVRERAADKSFLAGATCLGDILQAHGYHSVFLGGAPLSFAGKGSFLRDHGYTRTWGREEWERDGVQPVERNQWGLHDMPLFERARTKLDELHASGQPFNLTILTVDTHNPSGMLSPDCRRRGATDFEGIVACTADQLAEFVEFARARGYLKDTTIVIIGDHLAVPNPAYDKLVQRGPARSIFNLFIGEALPPANTDELVPFDLFPTLVELAGIRVEGDRLGLGYSAVGTIETPRPALESRTEPLGVSASYEQLWRLSAPSLH